MGYHVGEGVRSTDGRKLAREFFGLFLIFWGLLVLLSLVTYDQRDPSINHAVSNPQAIKNSAGVFGAYLSGLLVDIFGFAALVWPAVFMAWGAGCVSAWFKMPWWRWCGFTLLAACLISFGAAWNLGLGDVRGGGILGKTIYEHGTSLFRPAGFTLIWLFLLFMSLELAFGIAWLALIKTGWSKIKAQAEARGITWIPITERFPALGRFFNKASDNDPENDAETHADPVGVPQEPSDVIPLFDIHEDKPYAKPQPKRTEPAATEPFVPLTLQHSGQHGTVSPLPEPVADLTTLRHEAHPMPQDISPLTPTAEAPHATDIAASTGLFESAPYHETSSVLPAFLRDQEADVMPAATAAPQRETSTAPQGLMPQGVVQASAFPEAIATAPQASAPVPPAAHPYTAPQTPPTAPLAATETPSSVAQEQASAPWNAPEQTTALRAEHETRAYTPPAPPAPQSVKEAVASVETPAPQYAAHHALRPDAAPEAMLDLADNSSPIDLLDVVAEPPLAPEREVPARLQDNASVYANVPVHDGASVQGNALVQGRTLEQGKTPEQPVMPALNDSPAPLPQSGLPAINLDTPIQPKAPETPHAPQAPAPTPPLRKRTFAMPPLDILQSPQQSDSLPSEEVLEEQSQCLMRCLSEFNIQGELVRITPGPVITLFEIRPAPGVRVGRFTNLTDDLARSLKAEAIRIQAPVPGCDTVGVEIPNSNRSTVNFRELVQSSSFQDSPSLLTMALGKDIEGRPAVRDLATMPHALVAGTTGSGKSVCLNSILVSFLYKASPDKVKLMLIDPKRVEMAMYADLPHLVHPVVTETSLAKTALDWAVHEMDKRYDNLARFGVKNIKDFNKKILAMGDNKPPEFADLHYLPYLVIVIDELADLMLTAGKDVESCIVRLAQLARAAGIHLIVATQRPSVDVVTGLIKANFPCRISFQVANKYDSRTILDAAGAEQLLGKGDMLFKPTGGKLQRLHGPFVTDEEVQAVADYWKRQAAPNYEVDFAAWGASVAETAKPGSNGSSSSSNGSDEEALYAEAVEFVQEKGKMSISLLQRRFRIGFNKAARFVERMEQEGILPPAERANRARQIR